MQQDRGTVSLLGRRWLLNLVLVAVIAALAAFVALRYGARTDASGPRLTDLSASDITRIRLAHQGRSAIVLERAASAADGWRMTEPLGARSNAFNVNALLALAAAPTPTEIPFDSARLAAYGLAEPTTRVRFNDVEVSFGAAHPFKDQHYARRGERLFLVSGQHYRVATYPYSNFLDTQLLANGRDLTVVELPDFKVVLQAGAWQRQPPIDALGADAFTRFIDQWRHARALTVERSSGGRALKRITLRFGEKPPLTIDVLAEHPELVLFRKDEGLAYHFPASVALQLLTLVPDKAD